MNCKAHRAYGLPKVGLEPRNHGYSVQYPLTTSNYSIAKEEVIWILKYIFNKFSLAITPRGFHRKLQKDLSLHYDIFSEYILTYN